jgi:hypothetical protein
MNHSSAQLRICPTLIPVDAMQHVITSLDRIRQLLRLNGEEFAIENTNTILLLVFRKYSIGLTSPGVRFETDKIRNGADVSYTYICRARKFRVLRFARRGYRNARDARKEGVRTIWRPRIYWSSEKAEVSFGIL